MFTSQIQWEHVFVAHFNKEFLVLVLIYKDLQATNEYLCKIHLGNMYQGKIDSSGFLSQIGF